MKKNKDSKSSGEITTTYLLDGVKDLELLENTGFTYDGEKIIHLKIDSETQEQLKLLFEKSPDIQFYKGVSSYYTKESLYKERKEFISHLGLENNEILLILLLYGASWMPNDRRQNRNFNANELYGSLNEFKEFLHLIKHEHEKILESEFDEKASQEINWFFEKIEISFRNKGPYPHRKYPNRKYFSELFCRMILDYMELLSEKGESFEDRISTYLEFTDYFHSMVNSKDNSTHSFINRFIKFLGSNTVYKDRIKYTDADLFKVYIDILKFKGFEINTTVPSYEVKIVRHWYKRGEG